MNINNVEDLKRAYPKLVNEIISDALAEERNYNLEKSNKISESIAAENNLLDIAVASVNKGRRK